MPEADIPVPESDEEGLFHLADAFYQTPDHSYSKPCVEIRMDFEPWELEDAQWDIRQSLHDALAASVARKRNIEIRERDLTPSEKEEFRAAKTKEWGSFIATEVVTLASSRGIAPDSW